MKNQYKPIKLYAYNLKDQEETTMNSELIELAPTLALFCMVSTLTPGPNNILLAHSGAHFGMRKTLPHVLGIRFGMTTLHLTILFGLGRLFTVWPNLQDLLSVIACAYIIYIAIKIALNKPPKDNQKSYPMGFIQAASFQFINPKSWAMLLTASSVFTLENELFWPSAILGLILFNLATLPGTFMWITIGKLVSKKLVNPKFNRGFNFFMSFLLLMTLPMLFLS
jgi:threonine/homoserine/homoserine lactone efflux protein